MSTAIMQYQLLAAFNADTGLAEAGVTAIDTVHGVALEHDGHFRGIWQWRHGAFTFTAAGYNEPAISVDTVAEAVIYTRRIVKV